MQLHAQMTTMILLVRGIDPLSMSRCSLCTGQWPAVACSYIMAPCQALRCSASARPTSVNPVYIRSNRQARNPVVCRAQLTSLSTARQRRHGHKVRSHRAHLPRTMSVTVVISCVLPHPGAACKIFDKVEILVHVTGRAMSQGDVCAGSKQQLPVIDAVLHRHAGLQRRICCP